MNSAGEVSFSDFVLVCQNEDRSTGCHPAKMISRILDHLKAIFDGVFRQDEVSLGAVLRPTKTAY